MVNRRNKFDFIYGLRFKNFQLFEFNGFRAVKCLFVRTRNKICALTRKGGRKMIHSVIKKNVFDVKNQET